MNSQNGKWTRRIAAMAGGAALVTILSLGSAARANDYSESPTFSFSGDPAHPTPVTFTLGNNTITGNTQGVSDYMTFSVPVGDVLSSIVLLGAGDGSPPPPEGGHVDETFFGIASGTSIPSTVSYSSSVGLLGYTLFSTGDVGQNILPALGASSPPGFPNSNPGATTFSGPLGPGNYSTWLLDGDNLSNYKLDFVVSAAPEPFAWILMTGGIGMLGAALRIARRRESYPA